MAKTGSKNSNGGDDRVDWTPYSAFAWLGVVLGLIAAVVFLLCWSAAGYVKKNGWFRFSKPSVDLNVNTDGAIQAAGNQLDSSKNRALDAVNSAAQSEAQKEADQLKNNAAQQVKDILK